MNARRIAITMIIAAFGLVACFGTKTVVTDKPKTVEKQLGVTGAAQALTRVTHEPEDELCPSIDPEGKNLLFHVRINDKRGNVKELTIVGVDPGTGARRTLYTSTNSQSDFPEWMPDGSGIVYTSNALGSWGLVRSLSSAPGSGISIIASGDMAPDATRPSISPDGKMVSFQVRLRDVWNIATVDIEGGNFTILGEGTRPSWSPSTGQIAFNRDVNGVAQLFLINAATGTGLVQLTSGETDNLNPSWSPAGDHIVFSSNRGWNTIEGGSKTGTWNLYALKTNGTGLVQITNGNTIADAPAWANDGWIYFHSDQSGSFDIWRLKVAGELGEQRGPSAEPTPEEAPLEPAAEEDDAK